jgi:hypothetical protein
MSFSVLAVRTGEEPPTTLYPDPGDTADSVELEDGDGEQPDVYSANAIGVVAFSGSHARPTAKFTDITAMVFLTDSRLAVACSKYDKGGGWHSWSPSGLAVAVAANAVSKARAKRRRRGKMLLGQVRYEWLGQIDAKDRRGWGSSSSLRLLFDDPTGAAGLLLLNVTLDKHELATVIATDVARRAAVFNATHAPDGKSRDGLEAYARNPTYETLEDGTHRYRLPSAVARAGPLRSR